jgi:hypothetical protein
MSGIASVILAFLPALFPSLAGRWREGLWAAAVGSFVYASYRTWQSTQPILSVEIMAVHLGYGLLAHESLENSYLTIEFRFCSKSGPLAIKEIQCTVGRDHRGEIVPCRNNNEWVATSAYPDGGIDLSTFMSSPMQQGWIKEGWLRLRFSLPPDAIAGQVVNICVRDSYDVKHSKKTFVPILSYGETPIRGHHA